MGFSHWIKRVFSGGNASGQENDALDQAVEASVDPNEEEAAGLNFRTAIEAHQKWKARLQAVLNEDSAEALSVETLSRDDLCVLGKWIHGEGEKQFGDEPLFVKLRQDHARFHTCAGVVLQKAQSGSEDDKQEAQTVLSRGDYASASQEVIMDLAELYQSVATTPEK
ncbi:MAG: CZB domain-containing protein [Pontibacterium sp.]